MKKTSTVRVNGNMIFKGQKLTIGVDLGDHLLLSCKTLSFSTSCRFNPAHP